MPNNNQHVYGTSGDGFKITGVFSTEDNRRPAEIINQESGSLGLSEWFDAVLFLKNLAHHRPRRRKAVRAHHID